MKGSYEVEIKSLLGSAEAAEALRAKLRAQAPDLAPAKVGKQLNHYFEGGDLAKLVAAVAPLLDAQQNALLQRVLTEGTHLSIRSRDAGSAARLAIKASLGADSSANGLARAELDAAVAIPFTELDALIQSAGYRYQAKWSREREEYALGDINICIDKNAGYGYVAEFERVVDDAAQVEAVQKELEAFMAQVGAERLDQARLERMFAYYNLHWPEYYGSDKIFTIA